MFEKTKIKNRIKRIITSFCIIGLLLSFLLPISVSAKKQDPVDESINLNSSTSDIGKAEAIYAKLDNKGKIKNVYVVNHFSSSSPNQLVDFGNYKSVESLSLTGNVKQDNDKVTVNKVDKNFYYKGQLNNQELPWEIDISHTLNGQTIESSNLSGKAGQWELTVKVEANDTDFENENPWAENLMLQISVTLADEIADNIVLENGMLAEAGSNKLATFMMMPDADPTTYKISADIENFYLPSIQIAASSFSADMFDFEIPNLSDNEELSALQEATKMLSQGTAQLADGLTELKDGNVQLQDGLVLLNKNGTLMIDGGNELASGVDQYIAGIHQLSNNSASLREGAQESAAGAGELSNALTEASQGLDKYIDEITSLIENFPDINKLLSKEEILELQNKFKELENTIPEISEEISKIVELIGQLAGLSDSLDKLIEDLNGINNNLRDKLSQESILEKTNLTMADIEENEEAKKILEYVSGNEIVSELPQIISELESIQEVINKIEELEKIVDLDSSGLLELLESIKELENTSKLSEILEVILKFENIELGDIDIGESFSTLIEGYDQLIGGVQSLAGGLNLLSDGINGYTGGVDSLANNAAYINNGVKDYTDGAKQYISGLGEWSKGYNVFSNGIVEVELGAHELADGAEQLYQGTITMDEELRGMIDELMPEYLNTVPVPSFVSEKNEMPALVQFVLMTDAIPQIEIEAEIEVEEVEKSMWDRFLDLFSFLK